MSRSLRRIVLATTLGLPMVAHATDYAPRPSVPEGPGVGSRTVDPFSGFYAAIDAGFSDRDLEGPSAATRSGGAGGAADASVGYNMRFSDLVFGPELRAGYGFGDAAIAPGGGSSARLWQPLHVEGRGRLGVTVMPGLLAYAFGGIGGEYDRVKVTTPSGSVLLAAKADEFLPAFGVGAGIEYNVYGRLGARLEYEFRHSLDRMSVADPAGVASPLRLGTQSHNVTLGLVYHLD